MLSKVRHLTLPMFAIGLTVAVWANSAQAQADFANLEAIETQVVASLGAGIGEPGGPARPIDRRLRLAACPQPITVEEPVLGAVTVRCASLGWRIRVPLVSDGTTTTVATRAAAVRAEPIIRRGDQVTLVAMAQGFSVSTVATAEQDGAPGDHIRVRAQGRPASIVGQVQSDGRVTLSGFN